LASEELKNVEVLRWMESRLEFGTAWRGQMLWNVYGVTSESSVGCVSKGFHVRIDPSTGEVVSADEFMSICHETSPQNPIPRTPPLAEPPTREGADFL